MGAIYWKYGNIHTQKKYITLITPFLTKTSGIGPGGLSWSNTAEDKTYTLNVGRAVASGSLHRNVVIFLKVNAGVAAREQLSGGEDTRREFRSSDLKEVPTWRQDCFKVLFSSNQKRTVPCARWGEWAWTNPHRLWGPPPSGCFHLHQSLRARTYDAHRHKHTKSYR